MNGRFRQPFRPAVHLLVLTGSGFAVGLLMPQLYVAAHDLDGWNRLRMDGPWCACGDSLDYAEVARACQTQVL